MRYNNPVNQCLKWQIYNKGEKNGKMKRRILGILLAAMMLVSLVPMAALADEPVTAEAVVNGTDYYATLPEAVAAAKAGDTVKVLKDIVVTKDMDDHGDGNVSYAYITVDKKLTLDLNGKTIEFSEDFMEREATCEYNHILLRLVGDADLVVTGNGTLDCYDGTTDGGGEIFWLRNAPDAKLTIENGNFYGHVQLIYISNGGKVVINGGRFENNTGLGDGHKQIFNANGYRGFGEAKSITMYGGTLVTADPRYLNDGSVVPEGYGVSKTEIYSEAFKGNVREYTVVPLDCRVHASVTTAPQDYDYNHNNPGNYPGFPTTVTNYYTSLEAANAAAKEGDVVAEVSIPHNYVNFKCTACGATDPDHEHSFDGIKCSGCGEFIPFPFVDVPEDMWCRAEVEYVWKHELMKGVTETTFEPNSGMTRAMFITVLYRMAGSPSVEGMTEPFADVAENFWAYDAIVWGYNEGIIKGFTETAFEPNRIIDRAQIVTMLYRYEGSPAVEGELEFADAASVAAPYRDAVLWASSNGIVAGYDNGTFRPGNTATRAHMAVIIARYCEMA